MAGKNKGGREIRKPKQEKKPKASETLAVLPVASSTKVRRPK
ncbi:MAG: hypothetical protein QOG01_935 [Pseudonocardiales bacterium]|jgi:hypothetical protein|nr:hypothetical protein [Pseudonocardiales bacterium]